MKNTWLLLLLVLWPMAGAVIGYLIGRRNKKARDYFADAVCASDLVLAILLFLRVAGGEELRFTLDSVCGMPLYLKMDGFRAVYGCIAILMWMMTTVFSREYLAHYRNRNRYYLFNLITFGATVGVFLSGDLYTTYIFFEIMSLASYVIVVQDEKPEAMRNGGTYLAVGVIGGMVMLMGLFLLYHAVGSLNLDTLAAACEACEDKGTLLAAALCLLFGFGAKAGAFPLHFWLPKTHPVAPAPASALLSGILTKAGIYGILITGVYIMHESQGWGWLILILGMITMVAGAVLAVFSVDLKRVLACSSLSQIGFILTGAGLINLLGEENVLAVRGTILHMVNHSLLKLVLFMVAGVVYMNLHALNLNAVRGFGRRKPLLHGIFLMGVLGISGVPLWNGYISKTLLHEAIVEYTHTLYRYTAAHAAMKTAEWVFLFSGGLTLAYMLKLYVCLFWEKNADQERMEKSDGAYMNRESALALGVSAVILPLLGMLPHYVTDRIASMGSGFLFGMEPEEMIRYFSLENLKGSAISLAIGLAVYFLFIRLVLIRTGENGQKVYVNAWPKRLDIEESLYRPVVMTLLPNLAAFVSRICDKFTDTLIYLLKRTILRESPMNHKYKLFAFMRYNSREYSVQRRLFGSFSFGLLLFAAGLSAVLIYLVLI